MKFLSPWEAQIKDVQRKQISTKPQIQTEL